MTLTKTIMTAAPILWLAFASLSCDELPLYAPAGSTMIVSASEPIIEADGQSTSEISARIIPAEGIVADGTLVFFSTTLGTLSEDVASTVDGVALATLRSSPLEGTALVSAHSGSVTDSVSVQIGYSIETVILLAEPAVHELQEGESRTVESELTAVVTDRNDNRVARKVVSFAADEGQITGNDTVVTDDNGEASATFEMQVNESELVGEKLVTVNATAGGQLGTVSLRIKPL
ncbi:MAG: hypothetical protein CME06_08270 [Gemmatimonadetes bacterium]|nr:hypothetical protein [Gemmatimonadota bacterium]